MAESIRMDGLKQLKENLRASGNEMTDAFSKAIFELVNEVAKESSRLVPVDTGNLRSSRTVEFNRSPDGTQVNAEIAYGGSAAPYAVVQHERLDYWHPPRPPGKSVVGGRQGTGPVAPGEGRGPKYLEFPFMELMSRQPADLVERVRRNVVYRRGAR